MDLEENAKQNFSEKCDGYSYLPTILPAVDKIIVIGDLHGDWGLTIRCLKKAKLIDDDLNWIGGDTVVVQVGDQIDRCRPSNYKCDHPLATENDEHSDIKILKLFTNLHKQAVADGGAVYSLFGNHELMNIEGNMNYVSYKGLIGFADYDDGSFKKKYDKLPDVEIGKLARKEAFAPGNKYGKFLGCTRIAAIIIGSFLFVHAGILTTLKDGKSVSRDTLYDINDRVRQWVLRLINKDYVDQIVGSYGESMFWQRILGTIPPNISNDDPQCIEYVKPILKIFNINGIVIGHTPQFVNNKMGVNGTCDDTLWRIDTGASDAFSKFSNDKNIMYRKSPVIKILNDKTIKVVDI